MAKYAKITNVENDVDMVLYPLGDCTFTECIPEVLMDFFGRIEAHGSAFLELFESIGSGKPFYADLGEGDSVRYDEEGVLTITSSSYSFTITEEEIDLSSHTLGGLFLSDFWDYSDTSMIPNSMFNSIHFYEEFYNNVRLMQQTEETLNDGDLFVRLSIFHTPEVGELVAGRELLSIDELETMLILSLLLKEYYIVLVTEGKYAQEFPVYKIIKK